MIPPPSLRGAQRGGSPGTTSTRLQFWLPRDGYTAGGSQRQLLDGMRVYLRDGP